MGSDFLQTFRESCRSLTPRTNLFLIGTSVCILGIFTLLWGAYQYAQAYESTRWPATNGVVTYADVSKRPTSARVGPSIKERFVYQYSGNPLVVANQLVEIRGLIF